MHIHTISVIPNHTAVSPSTPYNQLICYGVVQ